MYLGAHISIQGKIYKSIERADEFGLESMQIFTTSPKSWEFTHPSDKDIEVFKTKWNDSKIKQIVGHSIYLTNFASSNPYIYTNSINSLLNGLVVSEKLGLLTYIIHLGSHKGKGVDFGIERAVNALKQVLSDYNGKTPISLEISAGSGDSIGRNIDELNSIMDKVSDERLGICIDTAHSFEAGYDIRTKTGFDNFLEEIDRKIGLKKLLCIHLNDSKTELGSLVDRHEDIGDGELGLAIFEHIINHPRLKDIAGILETPGPIDLNILKLRGLRR